MSIITFGDGNEEQRKLNRSIHKTHKCFVRFLPYVGGKEGDLCTYSIADYGVDESGALMSPKPEAPQAHR